MIRRVGVVIVFVVLLAMGYGEVQAGKNTTYQESNTTNLDNIGTVFSVTAFDDGLYYGDILNKGARRADGLFVYAVCGIQYAPVNTMYDRVACTLAFQNLGIKDAQISRDGLALIDDLGLRWDSTDPSAMVPADAATALTDSSLPPGQSTEKIVAFAVDADSLTYPLRVEFPGDHPVILLIDEPLETF